MAESEISSGQPDAHGAPAPLTEPVSFGRYTLQERVAVGGMAEIFRASYDGPHDFAKTLVVKRMLPHLAKDSAFVDMFIDEARLMGRINHPRVVQVFDFGEVDHQYFIAMEFVDGTDGLTLLQRCAISRRRPPPAIAIHIVAEILDALDYAHQLSHDDGTSLDVVHRDVSPSNLFISNRGDVKLGDFGIAQMAIRRAVTQAGILKGKYGYMAPEQVAGKPIDRRRDVFAAGIVLAELLMVRRLFMAENELDVLLQVRDARLDRLDKYGKHIPAGLRSILDSALARNPELRYQSAADFHDALMHFLEGDNRIVTNANVRRFLDRVAPEEEKKTPRTSDQHGRISPPSQRALPAQIGTKRPIKVAPPSAPTLVPAREEQRLATEDALAALPELERFSSSVVTAGSIEVPALDSLPPVRDANEVAEGLLSGEVEPLAEITGELAHQSLFFVLFQLARQEQSGLMAVTRGKVSKQLFLVDGHPEVVLSNQPNDLFGQFLKKEEVLTEGELSMALAMLPHFEGRLGDALVGLDLASPVEVLRHLTLLQRQKVLELFSWPEGTYAFHPGKTSQEESAPLGMTTFELLGAAVREMALDVVRQKLAPMMSLLVERVEPLPVPPETFQLGPAPRIIYKAFTTRLPLAEHVKRLSLPDAEAFPIIYLLLQTGYIAAYHGTKRVRVSELANGGED